MPVQVSYPGVYIQEIPSGVHTITGVSTSIGAFFGRTAKGPLNTAVRCLSPSDFSRAFGGAHPESDLARSVAQFFDNGGTDCYVVRLAAGAQKASITLTDISSNAGANPNALNATAKTEGVWGNNLRLQVDYKTINPDESFNLDIIQLDAGSEIGRERHTNLSMDPKSPRFAPDYVTQSSELIELTLHPNIRPLSPAGPAGPRDLSSLANSFRGFSQSRAFRTTGALAQFRTDFGAILTATPKFEIIVDENSPVKIDLSTVLASVPAAWSLLEMATAIQTVTNTQIGAQQPGAAITCHWRGTAGSQNVAADGPHVLRIVANAGDNRTVRIRRVNAQDFAVPMMMGMDQGGIEVARYSNFRPVPTGTFYQDPERLYNLFAFTRDQITAIQIDTDPVIPLSFAALSPAGTDLWFVQNGTGVDGVREKLGAIVSAVNASVTSKWKADLWGYHLAFSSKDPAASPNLVPGPVVSTPDVLTGATPGANFPKNVKQYSLGITGTSAFQRVVAPADKGDDGSAPTLPEYVGNEAAQTGFHALDSVDLFNLMVLPADDKVSPALHETLWGPASVYCQQHRAFLLIDAPPGWALNGRPLVKDNPILITNLRQAGIVKENSAVFYPRMVYMNEAGFRKMIGPGGAIAGLMARTDSSRGVWKAPAGTEASLRSIVGLEVKLTDLENGVLNKQAVNCLRAFPSGLVNWGARTMDGFDDNSSEWKYIPIRRLALFLEESLFRGTKWVVFEPNDEPLWASIRLNLNAFMMSLFRQGAFQGSTPDKAFFVKCDGETTTQNDRNLGIVNIEVGFAPLKPAEFVIIKIQQIAGDL
jgi:phage tail sheath protein FI